jgi:hypothetical protein
MRKTGGGGLPVFFLLLFFLLLLPVNLPMRDLLLKRVMLTMVVVVGRR